MLRKTWQKLAKLVSQSGGREAVAMLPKLEKAFAEWLFVEQAGKLVPNTVKVVMPTKEGTKTVSILVEDEIKRLEAIQKYMSTSHPKWSVQRDRLDALKAMPAARVVLESVKEASKRVNLLWKKTRLDFLKVVKADRTIKAKIKKALYALSLPLVGSEEDDSALRKVPWEGGEISSWPVEKVRLLEDEIRLVDLFHNALKEVASSLQKVKKEGGGFQYTFNPSVVASVAAKYGLPHDDIIWLSSVLKNKPIKEEPTAVAPKPVDEESERPVHPSKDTDIDQDRRAKATWEMILSRLPRAMNHYLKDFEVVYEVGTVFPPLDDEDATVRRRVKRFYLGKEHRKHFFTQGKEEPAVDVKSSVIYLPPTSATWSVEDLTQKLISKAVDIFIQRSKLLTKGDLEEYISKFFISEKDVDSLISALNSLILDSELVKTLKNEGEGEEDSHTISDLATQLKTHYSDPEAAQKFHEWWAEHQGHFTNALTDKRMIPLFHKWIVEVVTSMVNNTPSPKDVPYPVADFIRKMSSLDRMKQSISYSILSVREKLMQTGEPGTEAALKDLKEAANNVL